MWVKGVGTGGRQGSECGELGKGAGAGMKAREWVQGGRHGIGCGKVGKVVADGGRQGSGCGEEGK